MKYIIIAIITALLCAFCIANAQAQTPCVAVFGNNNAACYAKSVNGLWMPFYTTVDTNDVLGFDATGKGVLRKKSGNPTLDTSVFLKKTDTSRSGIVTTYFYVDSLYATIGTHDSLVKYSDSNNVYVTHYQLDTAKQNIRTSKIGYPDTASLIPTKAFLLLNYWKAGGNSFGANSTVGTNDAFAFDIETNNTLRARFHASAFGVTIGSSTNSGYTGIDVNTGINRLVAGVSNRGVLRLQNATTHQPIIFQTFLGFPQMQFNLEETGGTYTYQITGYAGAYRINNLGTMGLFLNPSQTAGTTTGALNPKILMYQDSLVDVVHRLSVGNELAASTMPAMYFENYINDLSILTSNARLIGSQYTYKVSSFATRWDISNNGDMILYTAPSGTAGNAVTFTSRFRITNGGNAILSNVPEYADNAAAITAGLSVGTIYRTGDALKIVH